MTSKVKVNTVETESGSTLTLGKSGDTVTLASGASQSGFGRTGTVDWNTTAKTASFTAVSGDGYFIDTSSSAITVTLPASPSSGDIVGIADYGRTFATNNLTIARNSSKIQGAATDATVSTTGQSLMLVYVDSTKGWIPTEDQTTGNYGEAYVAATGGTVVTCGDYKTHIFTGPGSFCVSNAGNSAGSNTVEYLVVAGGGASGTGEGASGAGGGGGGWRSYTALACASPINGPAALPVTATCYPITVGAGGAASPQCGPINAGSNSVFSTITSAGGGAGRPGRPIVCSSASYQPVPAMNGGSGGGSTGNGPGCTGAGGTGNTPPTSPAQGTDGGDGHTTAAQRAGGGGGGAIGSGVNGAANNGGNGGAGAHVPTSFIGPTAPSYGETGPAGRYFSGGGGGMVQSLPSGSFGTGGLGGGGGAGNPAGTAGATNKGGGAGAGYNNTSGSAAGGSGIVMIRYKFQ